MSRCSAVKLARFCILSVGFLAHLPPLDCVAQQSRTEQKDASESRPTPTRRALLVGVTKYEHFAAQNLGGPINDVATLRHVLTQYYDFSSDNVVCLIEEEKVPSLRPTRANIVNAFQQLAINAQEGDQIFILLSGHGDRQPEMPPATPEFRQPDGINETFLPTDIRPAVGTPRRVPNAIIDVELRVWLAEITKKKAAVWIVFDCCHSGDMSRGGDQEIRQFPPGILLPIEAFKPSHKEVPLPNRGQPALGESHSFHSTESDRLVALYACRPNELTLDWDFPIADGKYERNGILSRTLAEVLTAAGGSKERLTYRDVLRRIKLKYAAHSGWTSTPTVAGTGQDRFLFADEKPYTPQFQISRKGTAYHVNAGEFHGLTTDSVLVVYQPGAAIQPVVDGYARVISTTPFQSTVEPCAFADRDKPNEFPELASCDVARMAFKIPRLNVGVTSTNADAEMAALARDQIQKFAGKYGSLISITEKAQRADWFVRCVGGKTTLIDATGNYPVPLEAPNTQGFGTVLGEKLLRIYRAQSLIAVGQRYEDARRTLPTSIDFELSMFRTRPGEQEQLVHPERESLLVFPGEHVRFDVQNTSKTEKIDVALLIVGSDMRITSFYPGLNIPGKDIEPGEKIDKESNPYADGPPFGIEHLVAIAVPARNKVDFAALVQPGLRERAPGPGDDSPLTQLLNTTLNGLGTRGDLERAVIAENAIRVLSWQTVPSPKKP